jgi:choice-of-anchor A domain-containing protein
MKLQQRKINMQLKKQMHMLIPQEISRGMRLFIKRPFLMGFLVLAVNLFAPSVFALNLGTAGDYNAFIFGDFTSRYSDTEGRLAAGGNVSLKGYGVGNKLATDKSGTTNTLVVGGNLTFINGQVNNGNTAVGGTATLRGFGIPNGAVTKTAPIDFATEESYLLTLSDQLASMTSTGTYKNSWGTLSFSGDGTTALQVFYIDSSIFTTYGYASFTYDAASIPEDATVVINVSGDSASLKNFNMEAFTSICDNVLFNFYEAETVTLSSGSVKGSILAPLANIVANNGSINGTVIAASWSGSMQLNYAPFTETAAETTPAPEPCTAILLSSGLIGLAGLRKRMKRQVPLG